MIRVRSVPMQIVVFLVFLIPNAFSKDFSFAGRHISLPSEWMPMPDTRESCGGPIAEMMVVRNSEGTIWVVAQALPESLFMEDSGKMKEWSTLEAGSVASCPFTVMAKPGDKQSRRIVFPTLKLVFSFLITTKGSRDPAEALKWLAPPEGKEYDLAFDKARDVAFAVVSQLERSQETSKTARGVQ